MLFIKVLLCLMFFNTIIAIPDIQCILERAQTDTDYWFKQFSTCYEGKGFKLWHSTYQHPGANGMIQLTVKSAQEVLTITDDVVEFIKNRNIPFYWIINPHEEAELTIQALIEKGFEKKVCYLMLHDLTSICKSRIPKLLIAPINISDISKWLDVYTQSFCEYDPAFTSAYAQVMHADIEHNNTTYYAGYIDNKLVSIGKLLIHPSYSYIQQIATDPMYRGKGIASQIISHLLHIALENGSDYVLLETDSAVPLYEKIGFKKIIQLHEFIVM